MSDYYTEIERGHLWLDINKAFAANVKTCGIQMLFTGPVEMEGAPTHLVLAEELSKSRETIEIWGQLALGKLICSATITYVDPDGRDSSIYEITPDDINQIYGARSDLDVHQLRVMRTDVQLADWNEADARDCAGQKRIYK